MTLKHADEYRSKEFSHGLLKKIEALCNRPVRIMEVCGTHTVSIFRSGIRSMLPPSLSLLSGPGCPVCVTSQADIDAFIRMASLENVIITTFGDLMRVPGSQSSLLKERSKGRDVRMVYSTFDALAIARQHPDKSVVFLGVGFETTAPTVAAALLTARQSGVDNFYVYSAHKLVPPALEALMTTEGVRIDGFLLPGHVSVIIGLDGYRPFFDKFPMPCVVGGFEPTDILQALWMLVRQLDAGTPGLENAYPRAVTEAGNPKARDLMAQAFEVTDARWRGIGIIPRSGLALSTDLAEFDARRRFDLDIQDTPAPKGCACGDILIGLKTPPDCPLYKKVCTPTDPVGPCMVSSEGTCAAYFKYHS